MKPPRQPTPEETVLWQESNRTTTPARHKRRAARPHPPAQKPAVAPDTAPALKPVAPARRAPKTPLAPLTMREAGKRFKPHRTVDATLDLHGLNTHEAYGRVARFLARAQQAGHRHVAIITGKGRGAEPGVLRRALPVWLNEPGIRPMISAFSHARPEKGGEGVTHVLLKRL